MQVWFYYSFVPSKRLFFWGNSLVFKHEVTYCDWNFNDLLVKNILAAFLQHHNTLIWFVLYKVTQYTFLASAQLHKAQGFEVLFLSLCLNRELPRLSLQLLKYEDVCKQGCVCVCVCVECTVWGAECKVCCIYERTNHSALLCLQ